MYVYEFLDILNTLDSSLTLRDAQEAFHLVGAYDHLDEEHFWWWCSQEFSWMDGNQFRDQLRQLIQVHSSSDERTHIQVEGEFVEITPAHKEEASEIKRRAWLETCSGSLEY